MDNVYIVNVADHKNGINVPARLLINLPIIFHLFVHHVRANVYLFINMEKRSVRYLI